MTNINGGIRYHRQQRNHFQKILRDLRSFKRAQERHGKPVDIKTQAAIDSFQQELDIHLGALAKLERQAS